MIFAYVYILVFICRPTPGIVCEIYIVNLNRKADDVVVVYDDDDDDDDC